SPKNLPDGPPGRLPSMTDIGPSSPSVEMPRPGYRPLPLHEHKFDRSGLALRNAGEGQAIAPAPPLSVDLLRHGEHPAVRPGREQTGLAGGIGQFDVDESRPEPARAVLTRDRDHAGCSLAVRLRQAADCS